MTVFGLVSALKMLNNILLSYGKIDLINIEENNVNMMGPYNPAEPLAQFIKQLEKGGGFARAGGQMIANVILVSKGITILADTTVFNKDTQ